VPQETRLLRRTATFQLADRPGRLAGVRLAQEIGLAEPLDFVRTGGVWRLDVELPDVARMEYLFEIRNGHGARTTISDPANPRRAPGAFGEKSVLELDGYEPPSWLAGPAVDATEAPVQVEAPSVEGVVDLSIWTPAGLSPDEPAPLLLVHDGPEYARLGGLTDYLGAAIARGALPALRAALIDPGDRNVWYSANPAYAAAVHDVIVPALKDVAPATVRIGVGASLGGLAMLHVHRSFPDLLDGLFLQSASFFTPELDGQESNFSGYLPVTEFVASVADADHDPHPAPVVLTCGGVEENLANNKHMAATLRRLGYPAELVTVRDAHNFTAWRDALHPHLTDLVTEVMRAHAA
jgi:enterochelin esterase-like enzyme